MTTGSQLAEERAAKAKERLDTLESARDAEIEAIRLKYARRINMARKNYEKCCSGLAAHQAVMRAESTIARNLGFKPFRHTAQAK